MSKPHNHPAFPVAPYPGDQSNPSIRSNSGMSIRDFFAAAALPAIIDGKVSIDSVAEEAYAYADAMLIERETR